ncbi:MarR family transcriptional regulator [Leptospira gomenensis]|uniref:MarR family transcriptional regulator n=1 Tax=Leptospira gomenensis TaxID=2484974 RepID=A0A5F1YPI8_9LEPT|nr:MarR family transcriptional regulator [Leptospira gomenensis]TGK32747.1 MarR family transcriptional regulator [Leptospira gomenensis]TGK36895.1 MarR family transcriptional regulator [Leptospira gomenensis]TGK44366.1 MarR family transcriptional regulator [Leptospira gomenensis]TGK58859.1 MarR family transcriptional regulator [Leptospira gomenensis]
MKSKKAEDHVDFILRQWSEERPDLDTTAMGTIGRIHRLSSIFFYNVHKEVFENHGLAAPEFDVMAALLRSGKPYKKSPGELLSTLMITSGTMTNRIDRLESLGWVQREPDPNDRRGILIGLTAEGKNVISKTLSDHVKSGQKMMSSLSEKEQQELSKLLRKLLIHFEE